MPRVARIKSKSGIYHIVLRGINRQTIFENDEDSNRFIQTIIRFKEISEYKIFAYCLMGNHIHLLLQEGKDPLDIILKRICSSYVLWYNRKYGRIGNLFQDRFWSEPVESMDYLLVVTRYIFRNPIKAGIVTRLNNYKWTNYMDYVNGYSITETDFILSTFGTNRENAVREFIRYINWDEDDKCLEIQEEKRTTDLDAKKLIKELCNIENATELQNFDKVKRNMYLKVMKKNYGLSIRQIKRLTGISRGIIQRS